MMNILLLNNNPVVTKLVTLSAQKSSDKLDIIGSIDEISSSKYDLVVIDDSLYSQENMDELNAKVEFKKSLYICSRNAEPVESFTTTLKKPFLPTDLVELFISFGKSVATVVLDEPIEKVAESIDVDEIDDITDDFDIDNHSSKIENNSFDELETLDDFDIDNHSSKIENNSFDELETLDDLDAFDDMQDNEVDFRDDTVENISSILDKDDLKEVQTLLEESEKEEDDFELEFDDKDETEKVKENGNILGDLEGEIDLEDEEPEDRLLDESNLEDEDDFEDKQLEEKSTDEPKSGAQELKLSEEDEDDFESTIEDKAKETLSFDEKTQEDDLNFEDDEEFIDEPSDADEKLETLEDIGQDIEDNENYEEVEAADIESKIEEAMQGLSEEDLQSEIDEDILFDLDSLTSRDFKIAIGEELSEDDDIQGIEEIADELQDNEVSDQDLSQMIENEETIEDDSKGANSDGVESLKKLLVALSNENVAASLKGMKISINITLGDK